MPSDRRQFHRVIDSSFGRMEQECNIEFPRTIESEAGILSRPKERLIGECLAYHFRTPLSLAKKLACGCPEVVGTVCVKDGQVADCIYVVSRYYLAVLIHDREAIVSAEKSVVGPNPVPHERIRGASGDRIPGLSFELIVFPVKIQELVLPCGCKEYDSPGFEDPGACYGPSHSDSLDHDCRRGHGAIGTNGPSMN